MSRIVILELLQALKFKSPLPDTNLLLLVQVKNTLFYELQFTRNKYIMFHPEYNSKTHCGISQFVCADIGTRLAESTIIQKHMISTLPGVRLWLMSVWILLESA